MIGFASRRARMVFTLACGGVFLLWRGTVANTWAPDNQGVAAAALNAFVLEQQLLAPDAVSIDGFGASVAIDGNTAVIGADGYPIDGTSTRRGAAYVFVRSGNLWIFQAKLVPEDFSPDMSFGNTVAISGNVAVVGAQFHDLPGRIDAGAAYVFRRSGSLWRQETRLTGDAVAIEFGQSVAIDGATIVVGADDAENRGSAFVFVQGLATGPGLPPPWNLQQKLLAPNAQPSDDFARSVAIRGNTIIAGAQDARVGSVERGAAFVFNRDRVTWTVESNPLTAPDGQDGDSFGRTVAFDGVRAMIAAPDADLNSVSTGAVYSFVRQGALWAFEQKLVPDQPQSDADFGRALALDGPLAVAGIPESNARKAFVFRFANGVWTRERVDPIVTSRLESVALQATTLLIGSNRVASPGTAEVLVDQELRTGNGLAFTPPVLAAPVVNGSTVTLNWSAVSTATRYQLRAGTFPLGSNAFDGNVGNTTSTVATSVPNGTYFVRVHAVAGTTESAASNEVRVDVGPGAGCQIPPTPTNLVFIVTRSLVTLSWAITPNATSYVVEAGSFSGASNIIVIDTGNPNTQLMANAPPGTYFVRVRGKSACGVGPPSNQVVIPVS